MGAHVIDFWAFLNPVREKHSSLGHTSIWKFHITVSHNTHLSFFLKHIHTEGLWYKRCSGDLKKNTLFFLPSSLRSSLKHKKKTPVKGDTIAPYKAVLDCWFRKTHRIQTIPDKGTACGQGVKVCLHSGAKWLERLNEIRKGNKWKKEKGAMGKQETR